MCQNQAHVSMGCLVESCTDSQPPNHSIDLAPQPSSRNRSAESASNARSNSSSTPPIVVAPLYTDPTVTPLEQASSKENIPIAFDTAAFLRVNLQQLEIRVGSLERRMPLVERTTTSLQSILSMTKARLSRKSGIFQAKAVADLLPEARPRTSLTIHSERSKMVLSNHNFFDFFQLAYVQIPNQIPRRSIRQATSLGLMGKSHRCVAKIAQLQR
jgi:hypothetical protein